MSTTRWVGRTTTSGKDCVATAILSACGRYRYSLTRRWGPGKSFLCILLNPSTATADVDDNTIRKLVVIACLLGFDAIEVMNLFAFRATDPDDMMAAEDPIGPENDAHLLDAVRKSSCVLAGWGTSGDHLNRGAQVTRMLQHVGVQILCLAKNKGGTPKHPLYCKNSSTLIPYDVPFTFPTAEAS